MQAFLLRKAQNMPNVADQLTRCHDLTKWQLFSALTCSMGEGRCININGLDCLVKSISREDGSGSSFNVGVMHDGKDYTVYCRTKD
jgi:hypothetical protein